MGNILAMEEYIAATQKAKLSKKDVAYLVSINMQHHSLNGCRKPIEI